MKRFLPLIIFAGLCVVLLIGLSLNPKEIPSPFVGKNAPTFNLPVLGKSQESFSPEQMQGKVWLLNVWASWCVSCRDEHPILNQLAQQKVIPIVGLNYKDKDPAALEWLARMENPYILSVVDAAGNVGINYGVYGVPESFLIDGKGKIVHKFIGPLTSALVQNELLPKLAQLNSSTK